MILEYLFSENVDRTAIASYASESVDFELQSITNSVKWVARYSCIGENESSAGILSAINVSLTEQFNPTVLINESSEYYNRKLFPLVNSFERKLRKLLYLVIAFNDSDKNTENLEAIEDKTFGVIFETLFSDSNFVNVTKKKVNGWSGQFTKKELLAEIGRIEEDTLWDRILGKFTVNKLREDFPKIRKYRNHIMHAHNIDKSTYVSIKELFETTNLQIDFALDGLMKAVNVGLTRFDFHLSLAAINEDILQRCEKLTTIMKIVINSCEWDLDDPIYKSIKPKIEQMRNYLLYSYPDLQQEQQRYLQDLQNVQEKLELCLNTNNNRSEESA
jgi:hypothetical protein